MSSNLATSPVQSVLGLCRAQAGTLLGLELQPITVEVASRRGPAHFLLAGLADASVRESRVRVCSALASLGVAVDEYALTVNLAPANLKKAGSGLDLAIAAAICGAVGACPTEAVERPLLLGELALDGTLRPIPGVLPLLQGARQLGVREVIVPLANAKEAAFVTGLETHSVQDLAELLQHLRGEVTAPRVRQTGYVASAASCPDLLDVRGQAAAKRALAIAAAGRHHLLMVGPPGAGKTLLARRLPGLLPPLESDEALEATAVHSVAGTIEPGAGIVVQRPFRAPHHTVSEAGLIGGGSWPRPGEVSLAHHGVLFLDELPEFRRGVLESLRQPLEQQEVSIVRSKSCATFPARPLLVAAMNPCPCGNYGNPKIPCRCRPEARERYLARLSGPLLERIDLQVAVPCASVAQWSLDETEEPPAELGTRELRQQVERATGWQRDRSTSGQVAARSNSDLSLSELERVARPDADGRALLSQAVERLGLSARSYVRILRVARTIADLESSDTVLIAHVGEAVRYRLFGDSSRAPTRS